MVELCSRLYILILLVSGYAQSLCKNGIKGEDIPIHGKVSSLLITISFIYTVSAENY